MFLIMPELIASRIVAPVLQDTESLIITGAKWFSNYSGYASSLQWNGHHEEVCSIDALGRLRRELICIDALQFSKLHSKKEFSTYCIRRELDKAYCGFLSITDSCFSIDSPIATGNWGNFVKIFLASLY